MPSLDEWVRLYASNNRFVRICAAKGLLERSDEAPLPLLIDILIHLSHEGLGIKVRQALITRDDSRTVFAMIKLLDSDDPWLREAACGILGHSRQLVAAEHLLKKLDDPQVMVRRAAAFGLVSLKHPSTLDQIRMQYERHKRDDSNVVWALECALRTLGDSPTADPDGSV